MQKLGELLSEVSRAWDTFKLDRARVEERYIFFNNRTGGFSKRLKKKDFLRISKHKR